MHPKRIALTLVVLATLAVPASAAAQKPYLTTARAEAAMKPAVVESCRRLSRTAIHCTVNEYIAEGQWEGWTMHFAERATLARGQVVVSSSLTSGS